MRHQCRLGLTVPGRPIDVVVLSAGGALVMDGDLLDPIQEYNHGQGCSITGGMIYRGNAIPSLQGTYFYADYCSNKIWSIEYDGSLNKFQYPLGLLNPYSLLFYYTDVLVY